MNEGRDFDGALAKAGAFVRPLEDHVGYRAARPPYHCPGSVLLSGKGGRAECGRLREVSGAVADEGLNPVFVSDAEAGYERNAALFARFYEDAVRSLEEVRVARGRFPEPETGEAPPPAGLG